MLERMAAHVGRVGSVTTLLPGNALDLTESNFGRECWTEDP
jgi:hypothetical protein